MINLFPISSGCQTPDQPDPEIDGMIARLRSSSPKERALSSNDIIPFVARMRRANTPDQCLKLVQPLIDALDDSEQEVVWSSCRSLAALGPVGKPALGKLKSMLENKDESRGKRAAAAEARIAIHGVEEDAPLYPKLDRTGRLAVVIPLAKYMYKIAEAHMDQKNGIRRAREMAFGFHDGKIPSYQIEIISFLRDVGVDPSFDKETRIAALIAIAYTMKEDPLDPKIAAVLTEGFAKVAQDNDPELKKIGEIALQLLRKQKQ